MTTASGWIALLLEEFEQSVKERETAMRDSEIDGLRRDREGKHAEQVRLHILQYVSRMEWRRDQRDQRSPKLLFRFGRLLVGWQR